MLINSVPKSGTHLLHSMLQQVGYRDFQGFYASTSPLLMNKKSRESAVRAVRHIQQNELFCGHIFHSAQVERALIDCEVPTVFILRDPRAIFASELHYLSKMTYFHRYSRVLRALNDDDKARVLLDGIAGSDFFFPRFVERLDVYSGWLSSPAVHVVRFEDLVSDQRAKTFSNVLRHLSGRGTGTANSKHFIEIAEAVVSEDDPNRSHTYSGLDPNRWRQTLPVALLDDLQSQVSGLAEQWGYGP